jgi:hypothetical protein
MHCPADGYHRFQARALYASFPVGGMGGVLVDLPALSFCGASGSLEMESCDMGEYEADYYKVAGLQPAYAGFHLLL